MSVSEIARMTPQELADAGVPVEVALRAKIEHYRVEVNDEGSPMHEWYASGAALNAYENALAIIEAKS